MKRVAAGAFAALLLLAGEAAAQQRSQFITNNAYRIELFQGPILAPIRVTATPACAAADRKASAFAEETAASTS